MEATQIFLHQKKRLNLVRFGGQNNQIFFYSGPKREMCTTDVDTQASHAYSLQFFGTKKSQTTFKLMPTYPIGLYWPWNGLIENLEIFGPSKVGIPNLSKFCVKLN